ncbi:MAG: family 16 glycosylhydrolase [Bacteroidales bacterium]
MNIILTTIIALSTLACGGNNDTPDSSADIMISISPTVVTANPEGDTAIVQIKANREWKAFSEQDWIKCSPSSSINREEVLQINVAENTTPFKRSGSVIIRSGGKRESISVTQSGKELNADHSEYVPDGYSLIWNDEFNEGTRPDMQRWSYETGNHGWGNNELQNYVAGSVDGNDIASISDGIFKITAQKINGTVYSIRINTKDSWTYGYFEARLKLPSGKGTWPAFWMMPKNYSSWPEDGEIDIMEEVGYRPNWVSSAIHTKSYNHKINTEKTGETFLETAQSDFHIYALEWTKDYIKTYVDGNCIFTFPNDGSGNKDTWPFNAPFYIKLNLAWGGDWGGSQGVDESALPATYEIDYIRVYQPQN